MGDAECHALKDGFTWYEKLIVRSAFGAICCIGAVAIYLQSGLAAAGYLLFVAAGALLVVYDCLCVYCPYPFERSDCLFFPHQFLSSITEMRRGKISWLRKLLLVVVFGGVVAIPQYALWGNWSLFAAFWALAVPVGVVMPLHFCPRCRHLRCPANLAGGR